MNFIIDMNLSPEWVAVFIGEGWSAQHWSEVGDVRAADRDIAEWARTAGAIVFTQDLGFGALLALTRATGPSVVLLRTTGSLPRDIGEVVLSAIRSREFELNDGAVLVISDSHHRARILPLGEP
jgi:predicted nuclease of predicted toxin-antitoxin system